MWKSWQSSRRPPVAGRWAVISNERAIDNAHAAATECSRRRLERAEVDRYLSAAVRPGGPRVDTTPA